MARAEIPCIIQLTRLSVLNCRCSKKGEPNMKSVLLIVIVAVGGCTTSMNPQTDLTNKSTLSLCRALTTNADEEYRQQVVKLLIRRGATVEKCQKMISSDNSMAASIAIAGAAVAAGAAANSGGGGYYPSDGYYGVAWDQFYDEHYNLTWRCRDKSTGRFVYDAQCSGLPVTDTTWPGWSA